MVFIDEILNPELKASAIKHLNEMVAYAEHLDCRRAPLLHYFGEEYHSENCGGCDNCSGRVSEGEKTDFTGEARLFMSAMVEVNESFGSEHIISILRGSANEKVLKFRHDELASYGLGKNKSKQEWQLIRDMMAQSRLLKKDLNNFGILKLLPDGREVLGGRQKFFGYMPEETAAVKTSESRLKHGLEYDKGLFEILRKRRKNLADSENVPPYIIFPDTSLIQMCQVFPQNKAAFARITGVGQVKLDKYADEFIPLISRYLEDNPSAEKIPASQKQAVPAGPDKKELPKKQNIQKHLITGQLFNEGHSIEKLAGLYSVKTETIVDHLLKCLKDGYKIDTGHLMKYSNDGSGCILEEFKKKGDGYLKPVFDAFNGKYSYDELKIYQLIYLSGV
jgi:ATP-dependent DNA helicase RecQ